MHGCWLPRTCFQSRGDGEDYNANNVKSVESCGGSVVDPVGKQVRKAGGVETLCHEAQPQEIDREKRDSSAEVGDNPDHSSVNAPGQVLVQATRAASAIIRSNAKVCQLCQGSGCRCYQSGLVEEPCFNVNDIDYVFAVQKPSQHCVE